VMAVAIARWAAVPLRDQGRVLWPLVLASALSWLTTRATADTMDAWPSAVGLGASVVVCLLTYLGAIGVFAPGVLRDAVAHVRRALSRPPAAGRPGRSASSERDGADPKHARTAPRGAVSR
jgi:hypothetical protein